MSYCVNCGVKLAESEQKCPLCQCPVINPMAQQPSAEEAERPYPQRRDSLKNIVDRSFVVSIASILYIIPLIICLFIDWALNGTLEWSLIATMGILLSWSIFFLPILLRKIFFALYSAVDLLLLCALFFIIGWYTGVYNWIWVLGMPIAGVFYLIANLIAYLRMFGLLQRKLYLSGMILVLIGFFCVVIEVLEWTYENFMLQIPKEFDFWSVIVFLSCLVITGGLCYIERKKKLKKSLEKNLHI